MVRVAALALILLALANPSFTREDREPLSSVAAVVVDKSPSQNFGDRTSETEQAREALVDRLKQIKGSRSASSRPARPTAKPTAPAVRRAVVGAVGRAARPRRRRLHDHRRRVHDIPANAAALGFQAPCMR